MIRSHHETTFFDFSISMKQRLRTLRFNVNRMLHQINDNFFDASFVEQFKRCQSVSTTEFIKMKKNEITHSLNIVNIDQLKWWINQKIIIFLKKFDRLRVDRDNYLNALTQYQNLYNIVNVDRNELINTNIELDEIRKEMNILKSNYEKTRDQLKIKQHDYNLLKKNHETLLITTRNRTLDSDDEESDDENNLIDFKKNKRRFKAHSDFFTFINEVNSIWRVWKTKMHDKMTINIDHYDTNLFAITSVIEWTADEIDDHIQSIRDIDINHFKNWHMMLKFMIIVFDDSNYKRNMRNEFRTLIMSTQDFQIFFFIFLRFSNSIDYSEVIKIEKLMNKIFWNLKKTMSVWSREFITLDEIRITLQQIYNRQTNLKKEKIVARQQRLKLSHFKFILVVSISISFTKSVTSIFFVKSATHFHSDVDTKSRDSMIDKLIVTNKCFTCDESNHVWKECSNVNKHSKRHWHKMQIFYMNLTFDSSESNSKN